LSSRHLLISFFSIYGAKEPACETRFFEQYLRQKSSILSAWGLKKPGFFNIPGFTRANYHCSAKMAKVFFNKPGFSKK
jgi:hypothetical protein